MCKHRNFHPFLKAFVVGMLMITHVKAQNYPTNLKVEEKLYELTKTWQELENISISIYRNSNVDSDSLYQAFLPAVIKSSNDYEYYKLLQKFLASFNDFNTKLELPKYISDSIVYPPVTIKEHRGRFYVTNADKKIAEKIPIGSEIFRINGFEINSYIENEIIPFISAGTNHQKRDLALKTLTSGWINTEFLLSFIPPGGEPGNETVKRENVGKAQWVHPIASHNATVPISVEWIEKNIPVISLNRIDESLPTAFPTSKQLQKADALILDLRNCAPGDNIGDAAMLALKFLDQSYVILPGFGCRNKPIAVEGINRPHNYGTLTAGPLVATTEPDTLYGSSDEPAYQMPVVVVTDASTTGNAEHFIAFLKQIHGRITIVGETTAGSTGASAKTVLPKGGTLYIGARFDFYPGADTWFEKGIVPDIQVSIDIKSILNGEDAPLNKAIEIAKSKLR